MTPVVNQIELHPYFPQVGMREVNERRGIRTESWSPLGKRQAPFTEGPVAAAAEKYGVTPGQVILRWQVELGAIPIPKSATPERQRQNLDVFGFELTAARGRRDHRARSRGRPALRRGPGHARGAVMPATPYLRVDLARLRRNIERTAHRAAAAGVALRPHVKTHKSPDIARLQLDAGAVGITVATIGEAEVFAEHGCTDILVAYPLWLDDSSGVRLRELARKAQVTIGVDSVAGAARAGLFLGAAGIDVLVEVDSGHHRSGVDADGAGAVAAAARRTGLHVRGVFTFPGHSYDPDGRAPGRGRRGPGPDRRRRLAAGGRDRAGRRQRWLDAEPGGRRHRRPDGAAAGGLRVRRRPAVGAGCHGTGGPRAHVSLHA